MKNLMVRYGFAALLLPITLGAWALVMDETSVTLPGYASRAHGSVGSSPDEVKVTLEEVPPAVKATILREAGGGAIIELERVTEQGKTQYEAEIKLNGRVIDLEVAPDGTVLKRVIEDEEDEEGEEEGEEGQEEEEDEGEKSHAGAAAPGGAFALHLGPIPAPLKNGARFSAKITHPYLPLSRVRYTELRGVKARVIREVQAETKKVGGVECLVLAEKEYDGETLEEISYNYFAQDEKGNVFYFGEDVDEYKEGKVVSHGGAWLVGKNATEPCLFMPAEPTIGFQYKPENSPPDAEEWAEVGANDAELAAAGETYRNVLVIKETDNPTRWEESKYYAKDVGLISENGKLNLVAIGRPGDAKDNGKD